MPNYLLDTNAFNRAVDLNVDPSTITRRGGVFVTHIQVDELRATKRTERQIALMEALQKIGPEMVPTSAAVWDLSEWGSAEWGDANGLYQPLLDGLNARNGVKKNNPQDALIGVTALARGMILITDDIVLTAAVREFGGHVESFEAFVKK